VLRPPYPTAQLPSTHVAGGAQYTPHSPQLSESVSVSTQAPAQHEAADTGQPVPPGHGTTHAPRRQTAPAAHWPSPQHSARHWPLQQNGRALAHRGRQPQRFLRFLPRAGAAAPGRESPASAPAKPAKTSRRDAAVAAERSASARCLVSTAVPPCLPQSRDVAFYRCPRTTGRDGRGIEMGPGGATHSPPAGCRASRSSCSRRRALPRPCFPGRGGSIPSG
jgi:hypothetical protein